MRQRSYTALQTAGPSQPIPKYRTSSGAESIQEILTPTRTLPSVLLKMDRRSPLPSNAYIVSSTGDLCVDFTVKPGIACFGYPLECLTIKAKSKARLSSNAYHAKEQAGRKFQSSWNNRVQDLSIEILDLETITPELNSKHFSAKIPLYAYSLECKNRILTHVTTRPSYEIAHIVFDPTSKKGRCVKVMAFWEK